MWGKGHVSGSGRILPDILLTTPESIEAMLISRKTEHEWLFRNLQAVVVDEIHAFAGDDRGWHLQAVTQRVQRLASRPLQRIGLSATVGNPQGLLSWFTAGVPDAPREVVQPAGAAARPDPEVTIDYVGSIENAATVISRLHRGEKRLVFVDSRARVEELALALRARDVTTFLSHGSLGREERRAAEQAFAESRDCVIVATSTLELGIDVGDLDRVIQLDAPTTVASFLQRLGRTGRRDDAVANTLFLATSEDALAQTLGLCLAWEDGYVEPLEAPAYPVHLLAQQCLALADPRRWARAAHVVRVARRAADPR
jgi:ATP-dependent helicase Lhr and Lhr-like helicase